MSQVFIGIVFLAVIGGAAESGSGHRHGAEEQPGPGRRHSHGSSIQIALFVAPVLVLASGFIAPQPLELSFSRAEIGTLFLGVLIVAGDGRRPEKRISRDVDHAALARGRGAGSPAAPRGPAP
jgi:Ca2+:H+ antiporter